MQLFRDTFTSLKFGELQEFGNLRLTPILSMKRFQRKGL